MEDIEKRIADIDASLGQLDRDKNAVTIAFAQDMNEEQGVTLFDLQAQAILYPVTGGILIDATVVLTALTEVGSRIAQVIPHIGVASATRLIHTRPLRRHLPQYQGDWLPELSGMRPNIAHV